ncbi:MAG: Ku protein [Dermatophilaceae bacterium]|nr:Ku protein [Actinomycetales bacterium]MBP8879731.1 Ku protein [Dermatophilaceae bacterium]MBP9917329.1 Ku protein [Dermatophilaceae bacterium]
MRAMWKGAVSFGLVNVPVKLYSATENHDISFRQVHRADGGQIRYQRVCSACGEQVPYDEVAKGYETEDGGMVVLTDEDLASLPNQSSKEVAVTKFVPKDQIDTMLYDKAYYLEPEKAAVKPYALLRDALDAADRVALVTVSIRTRMTMAVLRVHDNVIVLQTLLWPDEIRGADQVNIGDDVHASDQELAMANMLVNSLSGDYDPSELEDDYAVAVDALVKSKLEGGEVSAPAAEAEGSGEVVDLLEALQRSVDRAKAARGEPVAPKASATGTATAPAKAAATPPAKKAVPKRKVG